MFLVAVTGGIACGKTELCEIFQKYHDIPIINADKIAREIVEPGMPVYKKIREHFGDEVFNEEDGTLNRDKLGIIIFNDTEKRRILNRLTHPVIHKKIYREIFINFIRGKKFAVLELPLLFELNSSMLNYIYKIICVVAEEDIQISRLISRNSLPLSEAKKRIQAQMNLEEKAKRSHFVIENSGSQQDLERQALAILNILLDSNHHWKLRGILLASIFSVVAGVFFLLNRKFKFFS